MLSPKLSSLKLWWDGLPRQGVLPEVASIEPLDLQAWLGDLGIVELVGDPVRFRIRLAGTNFRDIDQRDTTGEFLDTFEYPGLPPIVTEPYRQCVSARRPVHDAFIETGRGFSRIERLLLPFGTPIERILVGMVRAPDSTLADTLPLVAEKRVRVHLQVL